MDGLSRGSFLKRSGAATTLSAGGIAVLDVLAPSEKTFFLPPVGGWNHHGQVLWHHWDIKNWSPKTIIVQTHANGAWVGLRAGSGLNWQSPEEWKPLPRHAPETLLVRDNAYWANPPFRDARFAHPPR